ncbi:MAG: ABC transporter permease subunit [Sumerlaeia bacterium]
MVQYIVKRLLLMLVTLFGITLITFAITRLAPGEPTPVQAGAVGTEVADYDTIVERNRRNLGLDKPLFFNFDFEDRDYAARQALEDFLRPQKFWQESARRSLRYSGTIAVGPAIELLERLIAIRDESRLVDHTLEPTDNTAQIIDTPDAIRRLLEMMPNLAQRRPEGLAEVETPEAKLQIWKDWYAEHSALFTDEAARKAVQDYILGNAELAEIFAVGSYTVPYLIDALEEGDRTQALRANAALSGLTGLDFMTSADAWEDERGEIIRRWKSFYARESVRFEDYGAFHDTLNILANTQFGLWVRNVATFDFGRSYKYNRSVSELIVERLPVTFLLSVLSIFISYLLAIPIGIFSAIKKHSGPDRVITITLFVLYSLPSFWVAQMLLLTLTGGPSPFGFEWPELFPTRGLASGDNNWREFYRDPKIFFDFLWHLILPTLVLTYGSLAFISRQMRSAVLEVIKQDYIRTAKSKGLPYRTVVLKHAVRNSLIPIITISAGLLPELIAGSIIIEQIFTIPGMGLLSFEAILARDYPVVNAILFFSAFLTLIGILVADLLYAVVDPRISYK